MAFQLESHPQYCQLLHDAVQWYAEFTVFVQHFAEFIRAFCSVHGIASTP